MNLSKEFLFYILDNKIVVVRSTYDDVLKKFKEKITKEAVEIEMFDRIISIGDFIKVEIVSSGHLDGGRIEGEVIEICPYTPHIKVKSGWCIHEDDKLLIHKPINQQ